MKSKTSFFNKTIFKKNVCLYWPIWAIYSFVLFCSMPFVLWLEYNDGFRLTPLTAEQKFSRLVDVLEMTPFYTTVIAFTAVIVGMALFSYLYNSKSANMIHSLPVDRRELFGTNVISGLAFLAVPQVVVFIVTVLICLAEGVTQIEYLGMWLLVMFATDIIAFSVVTCCAMFTGQLMALPIYVGVVNCLAYVVNFMLELVVSCFGYGVEYGNYITQSLIIWLSPFVCYLDKVQMIGVYKVAETGEASYLDKVQLQGLDCIIIYLVLAVVLYAIAYFVYQKRQIEHAGDLITVGFVKPIFRWGVATIAAMYGSLLIREIFNESGMYINMFVYILIMLFIGMIFYFIADMFVRKTFHVFKKKNWIGCGIFSVLLLLTFGGMYVYTEVAENRVPKAEDVKCAFISAGYDSKYEGESVQTVVDIHKEIIDNLSYYEELDRSNYYWYNDVDYEWIRISYVLKDGETFIRSYKIPMKGDGKEIIDTIITVESEPENFLRNTFCYDYENITEFTYGYMEFTTWSDKVSANWDWQAESLTKEQMAILFDAIIADAKAGTLIKYNINYFSKGEAYKYKPFTISMEFNIPENGEKDYKYWNYQNLYLNETPYSQYYGDVLFYSGLIAFGYDCVNIINAMVECDIIEAPEDIYWYE